MRFLISWWHFTLLLFTNQKAKPLHRCRDTQRLTCNQSFATEFISVVLQDLPWNSRRKLEELKWVLIPSCWMANKLFLVNWWGIPVRQGMWWSLYELSQQKQIHPLCARVSQVHLCSQDPCCHRQNRVMKWLVAILICHVRVVIVIIIVIRIFWASLCCVLEKKKKILLAGFDWLSLKWGRLALSSVLIFHRGSLGFCLWCLSWNSLFTSLLHLAVLSTHLCMCRSDPARPQPHKTRARRLQSSGSAALLYLEQLYCFYNRKASGSFLLPLAPRK